METILGFKLGCPGSASYKTKLSKHLIFNSVDRIAIFTLNLSSENVHGFDLIRDVFHLSLFSLL